MFRPKSDAISIGQSSFKIPCRNGIQFNEDSIVRFEIPRNAGFVDLANSYLECEVLLENPNNTPAQNNAQPCLQLDRQIGGQALISQLTIRSEGRVLEELRNYNTYANLHYSATLTEGAMNRRSRLEGCAPSYSIQDNPYTTNNKVVPPTGAALTMPPSHGLLNSASCWKPLRRKICLPLLGGLFTNPRSHPAMVMPLEVEIIMEKALRSMRINNRGDNLVDLNCNDVPADGGAGAGTIERRAVVLSQSKTCFNTIGSVQPEGLVPSGSNVAPNSNVAQEGEQQLNQLNNCPLRVGQVVRLNGTGDITNAPGYVVGYGIERTITSIVVRDETGGVPASDRCLISLTFDADINAGALVQNLVLHQLGLNDDPLAAHGQFGYTIYNPRLVVQKVIPPPQVVQQISSSIAKGQYNQDIISWVNIDNAIPSTQTTSTNILAVDLSRVKSILSIPTSQSDTEKLTNSNAIQGQYLNATNYEYQIDNKLQPDRRVDMRREQNPPIIPTDINNTILPWRLGNCSGGFHRFELEKALRSANINVKNLQFITKNPSNYQGTGDNFNAFEPACWLVGRSLGAGVGTSQNLVAKSVLLYLNYQANSNMVKLLKNFLVHIRTISVSMDGVSVYY